VIGAFDPFENVVGEGYVTGICFELVDKDARVERDSPVIP
jgi:hypothetical protein